MDNEAMRAIVQRDLHDEDETAYRWSDDALDGHIAHALKEFSEAIPSPAQKHPRGRNQSIDFRSAR